MPRLKHNVNRGEQSPRIYQEVFMITINGLNFAASEDQFINGLMNGSTFDGSYKRIENGIVLRDLAGKVFAAIIRFTGTGIAGLVSASVPNKNGWVFYGNSYNEETLRKLGVESVSDLDLELILTEQGR